MAEGRIVGYVPAPGSQERTKLLKLKVIAGHNLAKRISSERATHTYV